MYHWICSFRWNFMVYHKSFDGIPLPDHFLAVQVVPADVESHSFAPQSEQHTLHFSRTILSQGYIQSIPLSNVHLQRRTPSSTQDTYFAGPFRALQIDVAVPVRESVPVLRRLTVGTHRYVGR